MYFFNKTTPANTQTSAPSLNKAGNTRPQAYLVFWQSILKATLHFRETQRPLCAI